MANVNRRLAAIASGQLGLFSREQARRIGVTDRQLRSRVASGFLDRCGPSAFRVVGASGTLRAELQALALDVGGDVVVSQHTAAALHGFDGYRLVRPFHLSVGRGRHVARLGHRIHTVTDLDTIDRGEIDGLPVTRAARTLIDLARTESMRRLTIALDSGLRDRLFTERSLHERIVALRRSGRYGIPALLRVIEGAEAIRGGHSWLEREFLQLMSAAGIPAPTPQVVLSRAGDRFVRVDFRFPGTDVVVEVLGYTHHSTKAQLRRDAERMNALLSDGFRPYQFSYEMVVDHPEQVIDDVRRALAHPPA